MSEIFENEPVGDTDPQTTRIQYVEPETVSPNPAGVYSISGFQPKGFLGKLFDTKFQDYVTPSIVKVVFWIAIIAAVLTWLAAIISGFSAGAAGFGRFNPWPGILAILFGWIPPLLSVIGARLGLEAIIALIRLSKDARRIRHHLEQGR